MSRISSVLKSVIHLLRKIWSSDPSPIPDDIRIPLGLKKGATTADTVARRMAIRAISGRQAVEAAREMREAIEDNVIAAQ